MCACYLLNFLLKNKQVRLKKDKSVQVMQTGNIKAHNNIITTHRQKKKKKSNFMVKHIFRQYFLENRNKWRIKNKGE